MSCYGLCGIVRTESASALVLLAGCLAEAEDYQWAAALGHPLDFPELPAESDSPGQALLERLPTNLGKHWGA